MKGEPNPERGSKKDLRRQAGKDKEQHYDRPDSTDGKPDAKHTDHPFMMQRIITGSQSHRQREQEPDRKEAGGSSFVQTPDGFQYKWQDKSGQTNDIPAADDYPLAAAVKSRISDPDTRQEEQGAEDHEQGAGQDMQKGDKSVLAESGIKWRTTGNIACAEWRVDRWIQRASHSCKDQASPNDHDQTYGGREKHRDMQEAGYFHNMKLHTSS